MPSGPTVETRIHWDVSEDAAALRAAMKGFGTDERAIIKIIANRSAYQRLQIIDAYKSEIQRDLIKDLKSETSGTFKDVVMGLMLPEAEYLSKHLNKALNAKDVNALIDILCTRSAEELLFITEAYTEKYQKSLADHVSAQTTGELRELLMKICNNERDRSHICDEDEAKVDAQRLKEGSGADEFIKAFSKFSFQHLEYVFNEYKELTGNNIDHVFKNGMSDNLKLALQTIYDVVQNPITYYAQALFKAIDGKNYFTCNDKIIYRIVTGRCEFDLETIKSEYESLYQKNLADEVKRVTAAYTMELLAVLLAPASQ